MKINKILIANRGEIACRIIRTCRLLDIATAAVYSDIDQDSLHVRLADEAYHLGPSPALDSYLNQQKVLEVARRCDADALHPGYGFLSENAEFAESCERAGILFIGPPASAIRSMGSKREARSIMEKAGVPVLPGLQGDFPEGAELVKAISAVGYPLLLKPSAGGGGKGMKVVTREEELTQAISSARREALAAFGSDDLIIERFAERARHIEIQVFADHHDNCIHLMERDCSIQRRHQKVIEEAPAPGIDEDLRARLGSAAVDAARAVGYVGAGTVEFLVTEPGEFFFMEMNTRLQVEHPVTEMITGIDMVEWQIAVAQQQPLPLGQEAVSSSGHAIEARLYAEDTRNDFLPASGRIELLDLPEGSSHTRVDNGVVLNELVGVYYDPMLMKVICRDDTRQGAIARLKTALGDLRIAGLKTNRDFLLATLSNDKYRNGQLHTRFLDQVGDELVTGPDGATWRAVVAAATHGLMKKSAHRGSISPWQRDDFLRLNGTACSNLYLYRDGERLVIQCRVARAGLQLRTNDGTDGWFYVDDVITPDTSTWITDEKLTVFTPAYTVSFDRPHSGMASHTEREGQLRAPMSGRIIGINVAVGDIVRPGDLLVVLEAMKMEHSLLAPEDGEVVGLPYKEGDLVEEGAELVELKSADPP